MNCAASITGKSFYLRRNVYCLALFGVVNGLMGAEMADYSVRLEELEKAACMAMPLLALKAPRGDVGRSRSSSVDRWRDNCL